MRLKNKTVTLDTETGEVIEISKSYSIKVKDTETFYITYIEAVGNYFKIRAALDYKILAKLCSIAEYNTGVANISANLRKLWIQELETSNQNISNSFKRLKELKLIDGQDGMYIINPAIFWKGSQEERKKIMKQETIKITFELE